MTDIITLGPHDPLPEGPGHVIVLQRFCEDSPCETETQIILTGTPNQNTHPFRQDGTPMPLDEAVAAGELVAQTEGIDHVTVVDRTAGSREQDILQHGGDHSVHMEELDDTDMEEGERGSDMRDRVA